jgi:ubiquinone/menaquinone biosynthesis C-methylase UbiE
MAAATRSVSASAPATVLDVKCGMGAYAVPLAEQGHELHLLDPVELRVREVIAAWSKRSAAADKGGRLAEAVVGDARDLPFDDSAPMQSSCRARCIT